MSDQWREIVLCVRCPEMAVVSSEEILEDLGNKYNGFDLFTMIQSIECLRYAGEFLSYLLPELVAGEISLLSLPSYMQKQYCERSFSEYLNQRLLLWNHFAQLQQRSVEDPFVVFAIMSLKQARFWEYALDGGSEIEKAVKEKRRLTFMTLTFTFCEVLFEPDTSFLYEQ